MEPEPREIEEKFRPLIEAEMAELARQSEQTSEDRKPVELDQQSVGRLSRIDPIVGRCKNQTQNSRFNPGLLRKPGGRNRREAEARLLRINSPP
ncbi:hypothetical protein [Mesorhizobium sp. M00.F.Ca.ET.216.01.1.1]|uniref:hypothetical protein n=1 Tax=Mesorhizobium sp. M00.F.Ca.ET.216.01.1.1 TaxID=2500528 RepID=UPI001AEF0976|nr:hypothetical protein [Mesorhizobium sp. M00.F.Ca.ET.216.01.1.1]